MGTEGIPLTEDQLRNRIAALERLTQEYREELAVVHTFFGVPYGKKIVAIVHDEITVDDYKEKQQ